MLLLHLVAPFWEAAWLGLYDVNGDGFPDKISRTGTQLHSSTATTKCFYAYNTQPTRYGEFRFVVGIESQGTYSEAWPYWISALK